MNELIPIKLREQILTDLEDDVMGLWFLIALISDFRESHDEEKFRAFVLEVIFSLLSENAMNAGNETKNGGFKAWKGSSSDIVKRIEREWIKLNRRPNIGEIVSFCRPEAVGNVEE